MLDDRDTLRITRLPRRRVEIKIERADALPGATDPRPAYLLKPGQFGERGTGLADLAYTLLWACCGRWAAERYYRAFLAERLTGERDLTFSMKVETVREWVRHHEDSSGVRHGQAGEGRRQGRH